jgi:hypothetical protein
MYHSKKIVTGLGMNYKKINVYEMDYIFFGEEHKDDTDCMHCSKSRYVKVINKDGVSVTIKVATKQLCCMPIMPRLRLRYYVTSYR